MSDEIDVQDVTEEPEAVETEAEAEELIVTLGEQEEGDDEASAEPDDEEVPESAEQDTKVIRMLRRKAAEAAKDKAELREAKRKLAEYEASQIKAPAKIELGAKPTPADFDYDLAKYEVAFDEWKEKERAAKAQEAEARAAQEAAERAWKAKLDGYASAKKALPVKGYEETEADALQILSNLQHAIIVQGSDNPALMVYALGKNPSEAKKLAAISDPVQFAWAVAKMEATKLKATPRKPTARPETAIRGSGQSPAATSANIEKLRAEAERTGNYSAYLAAKRKLAG